MRPLPPLSLWLLAFGVAPALAVFEDFYFAGNGGNETTSRKCGTMPYPCDPPNMCSKDTKTGKHYCCIPGVADAVCWNGATNCEGEGTNVPSGQQTGCTSGTTKYCCLKDVEDCTKLQGQFNICWSSQENALRPLNATKLNETFSSLSSASPSASSYMVDRAQLFAQTSTTPAAASASTKSTPTTAPSDQSALASATLSSTSTSTSTSSGLSGGAIGGIVGGVIGGLALLGAIGFLLWRRRKNASQGKTNPHASAGDPYQGYGYQPSYAPHEQPYSPPPNAAQMYEPPPVEKYAQQMAEAPTHQHISELDANSYPQQQGGQPR